MKARPAPVQLVEAGEVPVELRVVSCREVWPGRPRPGADYRDRDWACVMAYEHARSVFLASLGLCSWDHRDVWPEGLPRYSQAPWSWVEARADPDRWPYRSKQLTAVDLDPESWRPTPAPAWWAEQPAPLQPAYDEWRASGGRHRFARVSGST